MERIDNIRVFNSVAEFEQKSAEEIVRVIQEAIRDRGRCFIVLSGGETPRGVYRRLAAEPLKRLVDWSQVYVFFSDERCVAPNDPQSNYGMVAKELLSGLAVMPDHVHRMRGESAPAEAATEYEEMLRNAFGREDPRFDLVLLGIGEDGHTASLFPSTEVLGEEKRWAREVYVPRLKSWRVTLTFRAINTGRRVFILATGEPKARIVQRALSARMPSKEIPVTLVRPEHGSLQWMLDRQSASGLSSSDRTMISGDGSK